MPMGLSALAASTAALSQFCLSWGSGDWLQGGANMFDRWQQPAGGVLARIV
jgi:hypothetical protein